MIVLEICSLGDSVLSEAEGWRKPGRTLAEIRSVSTLTITGLAGQIPAEHASGNGFAGRSKIKVFSLKKKQIPHLRSE